MFELVDGGRRHEAGAVPHDVADVARQQQGALRDREVGRDPDPEQVGVEVEPPRGRRAGRRAWSSPARPSRRIDARRTDRTGLRGLLLAACCVPQVARTRTRLGIASLSTVRHHLDRTCPNQTYPTSPNRATAARAVRRSHRPSRHHPVAPPAAPRRHRIGTGGHRRAASPEPRARRGARCITAHDHDGLRATRRRRLRRRSGRRRHVREPDAPARSPRRDTGDSVRRRPTRRRVHRASLRPPPRGPATGHRSLPRRGGGAWSPRQPPPLAYHHPAGLPELRQTIAHWISRSRGLNAPADQIVVTLGAQQAIDLITRCT